MDSLNGFAVVIYWNNSKKVNINCLIFLKVQLPNTSKFLYIEDKSFWANMHSFTTFQCSMDNRKLKNCQSSDLTLRPVSLCEKKEGAESLWWLCHCPVKNVCALSVCVNRFWCYKGYLVRSSEHLYFSLTALDLLLCFHFKNQSRV